MEYHTEGISSRSGSRKPSLLEVIAGLSPFERIVIFLLLVTAFVSGTALLYRANNDILVETPRAGGVHREGIAGTPRFINPLLAISEADKDLTTLLYAGLMTRDETGVLVPELAERYALSDDGTVYTFTLRDGLTFHDGTPVTADDVVFTATQAANAAIKSPVFANWDNVAVAALDSRTVTFTLPVPYMPFIENTTLGILPKHIWQDLTPEEFQFSQFNITPVGSGPYALANVVRDRSGIPERYELVRFDGYALGAPHIASFVFHLYNTKNEAFQAYLAGAVDAVGGISPALLEELATAETARATAIRRTPLLRVFGVFFNHNRQPLFLRDEVRKALDVATPKQALVGEILSGYGTVLDSPLPAHAAPEQVSEVPLNSTTTTPSRIEQAQTILERAGWERNEETGIYEREIDDEVRELAFSLSTVNASELIAAVGRIAEQWQALGARVEVQTYDQIDLVQSVIRPRRFDALLFGMILGHELDLYAFWHSSQRNDPGLNVAQYADIETDALLEKLRTERDPAARTELYASFAKLVSDQHAAIFLYTPDYIYVTAQTTKNITMHPIAEPHERFDTVHAWYIETDAIWPFVQELFP